MQLKTIIFAILCLLTIAACDKHDESDNNAPVVTIASPTENESISGEVHLEVNVTDESLHEMEVKVTQDSDGAELYKDTPVVHDKTEYTFHAHFTPTVATETPVTLTIVVSDHSEHTTTKTLKFKVKP